MQTSEGAGEIDIYLYRALARARESERESERKREREEERAEWERKSVCAFVSLCVTESERGGGRRRERKRERVDEQGRDSLSREGRKARGCDIRPQELHGGAVGVVGEGVEEDVGLALVD